VIKADIGAADRVDQTSLEPCRGAVI
jgi:hypothetical protein